MLREIEVRKLEALKLLGMITDRIKIIEHSLLSNAFSEAEAEALIMKDLMKSLLITIRRLERL